MNSKHITDSFDRVLADIEDIGFNAWRAKQAYVAGDISLAELELLLEQHLRVD